MATWTFSSLALSAECSRRYSFEYEVQVKPIWDGPARPVGSAVHAGIAALYLGRGMKAAVDAARHVWEAVVAPTSTMEAWAEAWLVAEACVRGYPWAGLVQGARQVEQVLSMPVPGIEGHSYMGRLDLLVESNGAWLVQDLKTTSRNVVSLLKKERLSPQYAGYVALARANGYDVSGVMLDVVGKPRVSHPKATKLSPAPAPSAGQPSYHQEALVIPELDEFWEWVRFQIEHVERAQRARWPRNTGACFIFGLCPYYDMCIAPELRRAQLIDEVNYTRKSARHEELL